MVHEEELIVGYWYGIAAHGPMQLIAKTENRDQSLLFQQPGGGSFYVGREHVVRAQTRKSMLVWIEEHRRVRAPLTADALEAALVNWKQAEE